MRQPLRIGIDLDGVLIDHRGHKRRLAEEYGFALEPWQTNANVMRRYVPEDVYRSLQESLYTRLTREAPAVAGALENLPELKAELFVISARRADSIRFAQDWLVNHRIYDVVPAERIYFCGNDDEKRGYCDKLGIDMFLDDKVRVLEALGGRTKRVLFDEDDVAPLLQVEDRLHVAKTWEEFRELANGKPAGQTRLALG
ncbi:MAG TPA: hypothetical protein VLC10_00405 [Patescibacteria group bacterium]|nr:hypothetical protein [Patescibacteria group bacterium]